MDEPDPTEPLPPTDPGGGGPATGTAGGGTAGGGTAGGGTAGGGTAGGGTAGGGAPFGGLLPAMIGAALVLVAAVVFVLVRDDGSGDPRPTASGPAASTGPTTAPDSTGSAPSSSDATSPATKPPSSPPSGPVSSSAGPTTLPPGGDGGGRHLAETDDGAEVVLSLTDTATSTRIREIYRAAAYTDRDGRRNSPLLDAELAADGTVYLSERHDPTALAANRPGGTRLVRIAPDGTRATLKENILNTELSPDGKRLAMVVLSPDGNGDGKGTSAVRILDLASGEVQTLQSDELPLGPDGEMTTESLGYVIAGWTTDRTALVVEAGCCDSGTAMIIPADAGRAQASKPWPEVGGDHATYALGFDSTGRLLVQRDTFTGDGVEVPMELTGFEVVALDPVSGAESPPVYSEKITDLQSPDPRYDLLDGPLPGTPVAVAFDRSRSRLDDDTERLRVYR